MNKPRKAEDEVLDEMSNKVGHSPILWSDLEDAVRKMRERWENHE